MKAPVLFCGESNFKRVIDMQMRFLVGLEWAITEGLACTSQLAFEDECPIKIEVRPIKIEVLPKQGRVLEDKSLFARVPHIAKRHTLCSVIRPDGYVKCWLHEEPSMTDNYTKNFMLKRYTPPAHAPLLSDPSVPCLSPARPGARVGPPRSKRTEAPPIQNALIIRAIENRGCKEVKLAPRGHELNQVEVFQGAVQGHVKRWENRYAPQGTLPTTFKEAQTAATSAILSLRDRATEFQGWYAMRATGRQLRKRWAKGKIANQVAKAGRRNAEAHVFDWPREQ